MIICSENGILSVFLNVSFRLIVLVDRVVFGSYLDEYTISGSISKTMI
jgi:hypothetical protein